MCDVADHEQVKAVGESIFKAIGDVSILINNAAILPAHSLLNHSPKEITRVFEVNVLSHFWVSFIVPKARTWWKKILIACLSLQMAK